MPLFGGRKAEQQRAAGSPARAVKLSPDADVLLEYEVECPTRKVPVKVVADGPLGYYVLEEPKLSPEERSLLGIVKKNLRGATEATTEDEFVASADDIILTALKLEGRQPPEGETLEKLKYYLVRDCIGLGKIDAIMHDDRIEEVKCTNYESPVHVIHRDITQYNWLVACADRGSSLEELRYAGIDELNTFIKALANRFEKDISVAEPVVDIITPRGDRIALRYGREVSPHGPAFTIRKFPEKPFTLGHIIRFGTLTPLMAAYFWLIVEVKGFILVVGPMGSGKTTLVNGLITLIPPGIAVATVEDTPELRVPKKELWDRLQSRYVYGRGSASSIDLFDLVRHTMRLRAEYVIVGEVRGREAYALVQAVNMGCGGLTTFHASDAASAITRLTSPPLDVPVGGIQAMWCVAATNRVRARGRWVRRVTDVTEVVPKPSGWELVEGVFGWDPATDEFEPREVEELLERSVRLRDVMKFTGWTEDRLAEELRRRSQLIGRLVEEGRVDYDEWASAIMNYYREGG